VHGSWKSRVLKGESGTEAAIGEVLKFGRRGKTGVGANEVSEKDGHDRVCSME
jgi:hypothetical protein